MGSHRYRRVFKLFGIASNSHLWAFTQYGNTAIRPLFNTAISINTGHGIPRAMSKNNTAQIEGPYGPRVTGLLALRGPRDLLMMLGSVVIRAIEAHEVPVEVLGLAVEEV